MKNSPSTKPTAQSERAQLVNDLKTPTPLILKCENGFMVNPKMPRP